MCGIVAYIGNKVAREILLEGLKRLEYRGYDSAGIAMINGGVHVAKTIGRVAGLEEMVNCDSNLAVALVSHTHDGRRTVNQVT